MSKLVTFTLAPALALLGSCTTDALSTNATSQEINGGGSSTVTVQLWDPSSNNTIDAFWDRGAGVTPVPVPSMQFLITKGDDGGPLTRGYPTAYVWEISDADHVYKVWRVAMDQYLTFLGDMHARHSGVMAAHPSYTIGVAGTPDGGEPTVGPHIGPHGDGDTYFTNDLVNNAVLNAGKLKDVWSNPLTGFAQANYHEGK